MAREQRVFVLTETWLADYRADSKFFGLDRAEVRTCLQSCFLRCMG
jgi:hypothetical protein